MKTKWHLYILWSVFSLSVGNYVARNHESPSTRSPSRRETMFNSNTQQTEGIAEAVHVLPAHSDAVSSSSRPGAALQPVSRPQGAAGGHGLRSQPYLAYLPDVSVTCSNSDFVVRVKTAFYGHGASAEELRLGRTCKSNGALGPYGDLLFAYRITECDVQREVV